jgi:hypothetical protein
LIIWLSWIDDCLCLGKDKEVMKAKANMMTLFDCDDVGDFTKYIGCKIDHNRIERSLKMMQLVLLHSYQDEFDLPRKVYETPAETGKVLHKVDKGQEQNQPENNKF